jgi:hypothetical protein
MFSYVISPLKITHPTSDSTSVNSYTWDVNVISKKSTQNWLLNSCFAALLVADTCEYDHEALGSIKSVEYCDL